MFDVTIMGILGLIGYILYLLKFPEAPLLVAFVLGPLFEDNLQRSLLISHGSLSIFFSSAICWIFFILALLSLTYTIYMSYRQKNLPQEE
jgi:putative tricarboxylic transport membrane protein